MSSPSYCPRPGANTPLLVLLCDFFRFRAGRHIRAKAQDVSYINDVRTRSRTQEKRGSRLGLVRAKRDTTSASVSGQDRKSGWHTDTKAAQTHLDDEKEPMQYIYALCSGARCRRNRTRRAFARGRGAASNVAEDILALDPCDGWTSDETYKALEMFAGLREEELRQMTDEERKGFEQQTRWARSSDN